MYQAKRKAQRRVRGVYKTMHPKALAPLQWSALTSGRITGFEALLATPRTWTARTGEFISVAEETGLIVPIWWVLREAMPQMRLASNFQNN